MPPRRRIVGRDAHQPVHPAFRFQPAIGIRPADLVGGRFDPRLFAVAHRLQFNLVAFFLGPADIHPRQHGGPVAGLGAPGPGVDFKECVVVVGLAVEQRFQFLAARQLDQIAQRGLGLGHDPAVALGLAQLDQFDIVAQPGVDQLVGRDFIQQRLTLAHHLLRPGRIGPQIAVLDQGVHFLEPVRRGRQIHPLPQQGQRLGDGFNVFLGLGSHGIRLSGKRSGRGDSGSGGGGQGRQVSKEGQSGGHSLLSNFPLSALMEQYGVTRNRKPLLTDLTRVKSGRACLPPAGAICARQAGAARFPAASACPAALVQRLSAL